MKLTDTGIRNVKPRIKSFKLTDGLGLYLLISPSGSKSWYRRFRFAGKENRISFGAYPAISLAQARQENEKIAEQLAAGINPVLNRRKDKNDQQLGTTFKAFSDTWFKHFKKISQWSESYADSIESLIDRYMTSTIGDKLIINLKTKDLMLAQQKAADLGYLETANRVKQHVTSIMRYAVQKGVIESNPAHDLKDSIKTQKTQHFPALSLELLPEFWRRLDLYSKGRARKTTIIALKLFMYIFVRSSELRLGRWPEIDFDSKMKMWLIPDNREPIDGVRYSYRGAKMSGYFVPLSTQSQSLLSELKEITGTNNLIFPSLGKPNHPLSENTINQALRRMGWDTTVDVCCHGLRTTACTALNESGLWAEDVIERQMSHQERNTVRAAYIHKAKFIHQRYEMMQWWADYLDANRDGYIHPYEFQQKKQKKK